MKKTFPVIFGWFILIGSMFTTFTPVQAHEPIREQNQQNLVLTSEAVLNLGAATVLKDPTAQSLAVYGRLNTPDQIDLYSFTPSQDQIIPVEVLVPIRISNEQFRPSFAFIEAENDHSEEVPHDDEDHDKEFLTTHGFTLPDGYSATTVPAPIAEVRENFFEPFSLELFYKGTEKKITVQKGHTYYVAVFDPDHYMGDYSLGLGTVEDFSHASFPDLLKDVFLIKMALVGQIDVPWLDIVGLFLFIAGFVIGLGAVTVIDFHGLLGRKSAYWTETATRTHKITKPLIWAGITVATIGALLFYRRSGLNATAFFHLLLLLIIVINGLYLSFKVSPYLLQREKDRKAKELIPPNWQRKIMVSFIISLVSWWSALFLLVWAISVTR